MLYTWDFVLTVLGSTIKNPQFAMFCLVLLWIFFEKTENRMKLYSVYTVVFFLIYIFPLTAHVIIRYATGAETYWRMFWLLPIGLVLSYFVTSFGATIKSNSLKVLYTLLFVAVLWLNVGGVTPYSIAERTDNPLKIPNEVITIIDIILDDAIDNDIEQIQGVFPSQMYAFVPQYTSQVRTTLHGYNMLLPRDWYFDEEATAEIFGILNLDYFDLVYNYPIDWGRFGNAMATEGSNYLVIWKDLPNLDILGNGFEKVTVVYEYAIFRAEELFVFPTMYKPKVNFFNQELNEYGELDFSPVYNFSFFVNRYEHVRERYGDDPIGALSYFVNYGIEQGLQGSPNFNVLYYRKNYDDLDEAFGENLELYYYHFLFGRENRIASRWVEATIHGELDYFRVYDFDFFVNNNQQVLYDANVDVSDERAVFAFFIEEGLDMGLQGSKFFDVNFYKEENIDLAELFGYDWRRYYLHFIQHGHREERYGFRPPSF